MMLTKEQIQLIKNYLIKGRIENHLFFQDMVDHIACQVEDEMNNGKSFKDSLNETLKQYPTDQLKEIELFTLKTLNMETSFSTRTALLTIFPFVMFGLTLATDMVSTISYSVYITMFLISITLMFITLGIGWIKEFPRWCVPAIGFCLLFCLFFSFIRIPSFSDDKLGIWAWTPLLTILLVSSLFNRSIQPIKSVIHKIKEEPSLIFLITYGFLPFVIFLLMDEIHAIGMLPSLFLSIGCFCLGLYLALRCKISKHRKNYLLLSYIFPLSITITSFLAYWS